MTDFISIKEHRKLVSVDMVFAKFNTERRTGADPYWFSPFTEISKIIQNVNSGKATVRQGTYKKNSFQYEKLCIKTRFETEVTGTGMAYSMLPWSEKTHKTDALFESREC